MGVRDPKLPNILRPVEQNDEDPESAGALQGLRPEWYDVYDTSTKSTQETERRQLDVVGTALTMHQGRPDYAQRLSPEQFSGGRVLVFVCGSAGMVQDVSREALRHGYDFHSESFEL